MTKIKPGDPDPPCRRLDDRRVKKGTSEKPDVSVRPGDMIFVREGMPYVYLVLAAEAMSTMNSWGEVALSQKVTLYTMAEPAEEGSRVQTFDAFVTLIDPDNWQTLNR